MGLGWNGVTERLNSVDVWAERGKFIMVPFGGQ